ncbi:MAG: hypothetical protein QNL80_11575 [Akkermansiaceae bacterium]
MKLCYLIVLLFPIFASAQVTFSERLNIISKQLGEGGVHYSVTDSEHDIEALASSIDNMIGSFAPDMPFDLNLQKMGDQLGIYEILGSGSSSSKEDAFWHNRSFMLTSGKHNGLLSLLGQDAIGPIAPAYAPAGTDLILETSLDLRQVEQIARRIAGPFGDEATSELDAIFSQQVGPEQTVSGLLKDLKPRLSLALWLDDSNKAELGPDTEIAAPHLVARIDKGKAIWDLIEPLIKDDSEIVEKDGGTFYYSPDEEETPWGPIVPHFVFHAPSSTLWFALHKGDLEKCWADNDKLVNSAAYKNATAKLPSETNANAYISADGVTLLGDLMTMAQGLIDEEEAAQMLEFAKPFIAEANSPHGYAASVTVLKNGILSVTNSPIPYKGPSAIGGPGAIAGVAVLAGLATPAVMKAKGNADKAQEINKLKQLSLYIIEYDSEFDSYPPALSNLVSDKIMEQDVYDDIIHPDLVYRGDKLGGGNFARSSDIVMYLELENGEVVYGRADASVQVAPLQKFRKLLAKQEK